MEAITHLFPQSEIAAKSFAQYQLGDSGNVGSFENGRGPATHSITSSARPSSGSGTVRPSALAVFRLITSSYLFGACTGRSAGFSPLRMRSTYSPHSRYQLWIAAGHRRRQANILDAPRQCFSGYLLMNPSRLGIFTLGKVSAFIASFSPIILLSARI